ncbi:MAG TPA: glycosyltransferase family 4 protein [Gaiella sp.]|nr:glycosyltransferase family 4 protein [Gaiella sp.]
MRILLWHGYLLGGTGSNVYTRQLAREWSRAGHDVTVLSQEPRPEAYDLGGAATVRPDVGGFLPVFVLDRYEGYEVRRVQECTRAELDAWVEANAAAIRSLLPADLVFTNHVLLGGPVGAESGAPFAVKAHGSELEYSMRGNAGLESWGRESLERARATFVGSEHIRAVLREVCGPVDRVHEVPPGVDVELWLPEDRADAFEALIHEARLDASNPGNRDERLPDEGNAGRLETFLAGETPPTIVFFGKLIQEKGVDVLLDAMRGLDARLVVVGFGPERATLEARVRADGVRAIFTGPLEHRHLRHLLALADACVVPSVFPEAFGMVAAEAAAAGCPPVVARHSGLAEVAAGLEQALPPELASLVSFPSGDATALNERLTALLALGPHDRVLLRSTVRRVVEERWSWAGVAERLLNAVSDLSQTLGAHTTN